MNITARQGFKPSQIVLKLAASARVGVKIQIVAMAEATRTCAGAAEWIVTASRNIKINAVR